MNNDVVPSHFETRPMAPQHRGAFRLHGLFSGEVLGVVYPDDPASVTKRFIEYRVGAQVVLDNCPAVIELPHCVVMNDLGGLADFATHTLRPDAKAFGRKATLGSKVLVQCINGDPNNAVIVGGIRDSADATEVKDAGRKAGHHLIEVFNGVRWSIDDAGALTIERLGPTKADGTLDTDKGADARRGARVVLDADGGVTVATTVAGKKADDPREVEQQLKLDHAGHTMTLRAKKKLTIQVADGPIAVETKEGVSVTASGGDVEVVAKSGDVTLSAPKGTINAGAGADQAMLLGDDTVQWLSDLCSAIGSITVGTALGPSSPPFNAPQFVALAARGKTLLSRAAKVKRTP